jgi:hypothetical protein
MHVSVSKLFFVSLLLLSLSGSVLASGTFTEAARLLPDKVGDATARGKALPPSYGIFEHIKAEEFGVTSTASRPYISARGQQFGVQLVQTRSDAHAYALLRRLAPDELKTAALNDVGTAAFISLRRLAFYKGTICVTIESEADVDDAVRLDFARALAATLDGGAGEIPPLVKRLPDWQTAQARAAYLISSAGLQAAVRSQPVLDAVSFEGGTEAVAARYDQGQLVIVEFQTPQLASDTDARIVQRIAELRAQNKLVPSAYRREGNYSVFVFDAPSEQAAQTLISQVKYEKVVQWLGEDPHRNERANRFWINMSSSLIINTVKATGLAILLCLGVGGLFGGVIFMRRRAQAALSEKYSDAGGMMRLNLDELATEQTTAARLLPPREE